MSKTIQAIRGMNDLLPEELPIWQFVEQTARDTHGHQLVQHQLYQERQPQQGRQRSRHAKRPSHGNLSTTGG